MPQYSSMNSVQSKLLENQGQCYLILHSFGGSDSKESACNAQYLRSIPGQGRSPGEGNGCSVQYSCRENSWTEEPGGLPCMGSQRVGHD